MSSSRLITLAPSKAHTASIICLHGLGDNGTGWSWLGENFHRRGKFQDVKFIFPSAPRIPITVNGGMLMPGWYDIINFDTLNRSDDEPGVMRSRDTIFKLIQNEIDAGIPSNRIILGGFSQGGAMSIFSGLTFPGKHQLCGIFGLSCYQLLPKKFEEMQQEDAVGIDGGAAAVIKQRPPIFMGHGTADPIVQFDWGKATAEGLKQKGFNVEFHDYPGLPHSAADEELDDLERWIQKRLDSTKGAL